ncbi:MAG: ATP-binding protein [Burkholderiales bacterium]|nr:ATP-binding protein [Opitutaceae bacterium]
MSDAPASQLITLTNDLAEIPRLAEAVEVFVEPFGPSMKDTLAIQLALEETVTNIINHGYKADPAGTRSFTVTLSASARRCIRMVITDDAPAYDPLARPEVNLDLPIEDRPIGGLGVHLVKNLMQHAAYERREGRNVLTLDRVLNAPQA